MAGHGCQLSCRLGLAVVEGIVGYIIIVLADTAIHIEAIDSYHHGPIYYIYVAIKVGWLCYATWIVTALHIYMVRPPSVIGYIYISQHSYI